VLFNIQVIANVKQPVAMTAVAHHPRVTPMKSRLLLTEYDLSKQLGFRIFQTYAEYEHDDGAKR
jgi:hypothetical protein